MMETMQEKRVLHMARITLEARTPLSIGAGDDAVYDVTLARDANGLPCIPGPSLQGVLRHLWRDVYADTDDVGGLFGTEEKGREQTSRVVFGWGCVHDGAGAAVVGRHAEAPEFADLLLMALAEDAPLERQHVRLTHRHVSSGRSKHERSAVPRGTRFSHEITMWGAASQSLEDVGRLKKLLALLAHPAFRLGGAGGRGYGAVTVVRASYGHFDFDEAKSFGDLRSLRGQPPSQPLAIDIKSELERVARTGVVTATVRLRPLSLWRIGQTGQAQTDRHEAPDPDARRTKPADLAPVRDPWISWQDGRGTWREPDNLSYLVAGAGIRGALAHRALYAWNCRNGRLLDVGTPDDAQRNEARKKVAEWAARPPELQRFFGIVEGENGSKKSRAGRLLVDDAIAAATHVQAIDHSSIDRYTGGVRERILYSEEAALGGDIALTITIRSPHRQDDRTGEVGGWPRDVAAAFLSALDDLCAERLALGAKSMGFARGDVVDWKGDESLCEAWSRAWQETRRAS